MLLLCSNGLNNTDEKPKAVHGFFIINIDMRLISKGPR